MEADKSFYVTLPSNDASYSNNKISNFRTRLAKPLVFTGKYECALTSISFSKSWYTVSGTTGFFRRFFGINQKSTEVQVSFPKGSFDNESHFCSYLNKHITDAFSTLEEIRDRRPPLVDYERSIRKFVLETGYGNKSGTYIVEFPEEINNILGFPVLNAQLNLDDYRTLYKPDDKVVSAKTGKTYQVNEYTKEQFTPAMVKNLQERENAAWQEYNAKITSQNPDAAKALGLIKSNDSKTVIPIEAIHTSTFETLYRNIFVYCD